MRDARLGAHELGQPSELSTMLLAIQLWWLILTHNTKASLDTSVKKLCKLCTSLVALLSAPGEGSVWLVHTIRLSLSANGSNSGLTLISNSFCF